MTLNLKIWISPNKSTQSFTYYYLKYKPFTYIFLLTYAGTLNNHNDYSPLLVKASVAVLLAVQFSPSEESLLEHKTTTTTTLKNEFKKLFDGDGRNVPGRSAYHHFPRLFCCSSSSKNNNNKDIALLSLSPCAT